MDWSRQYGTYNKRWFLLMSHHKCNLGPLVSHNLFGKTFIILNTLKTTNDLLEKRSKIYSDRPQTWMHSELIGRKLTVFSVSSQHPCHKIYRRLLHFGLSSRAIPKYYNLIEQEARTLVQDLIESPAKFAAHLRR